MDQAFPPTRRPSLERFKPVAGLYLHTPFCFHKCHYCDFYSITDANGDRQAAFINALLLEIQSADEQHPLRPKTLFVGGGTPTLIEASHWGRLLQYLHEASILDRVTEFTVEANPETIDESLMHLLAQGGVNRISIGAQTFWPHHLKTLERWHEPENVARAVARIRQAGVNEINLDLIFAIPGQTLSELNADLDKALSLAPTHLSCYSLIYEPNTAMTQRLKAGEFQPLDQELERDMYARVMAHLHEAGYEQYEISNWAKRPETVNDSHDPAQTPSPHRCQHNMNYWTHANWLGCGPSAASHFDGVRWKNEAHLGRYLAGSPHPPIVEWEQLPADRRLGEQLMLGLRLNEGVARSWLEANLTRSDPRHVEINELTDRGLLEQTKKYLRLTKQGRFVADAVIARLL